MNCFYHPSVTALGICRNCQKGLCSDCAADLKNGLACKNRCENEVVEVVAMINRNKIAYGQAVDSQFGTGVFWTIIGSVALLAGFNSQAPDAFYFFGIVFLVSAAWAFMAAVKNRKLQKEH